jgi:uncharacterized protein YprB with RNaseH-like and TPR domain
MLNNLDIENILFVDIETVPISGSYEEMPDSLRILWDKKASYLKRETDDTPKTLFSRAGIYAEFGKIICVSAGYLRNGVFRIKSFYGDDEKQLLKDFSNLLNNFYNKPDKLLCAHNGKEFDYPFLSRRFLVNGIELPSILDLSGKKPWEVPHLDTMEMWKFGDYKNFTSLELLAALFDIPTPKDDIEGSDVHRVYWEDHDLLRIVNYCQKDVLAIAQLFLKYQLRPLIPEDNVIII